MTIISDIEAGKKQSVIATSRGLAKTTVNTIWTDREKIKRAYKESSVSSRKRLRAAAFEDVESALLKWFQLVRSQNIPVNGQLLREKAALFAEKLKHDNFQCSGGWLDRFKLRHGIVFREVCGEAAAVDDSTVTTWLEKTLPPMLSSYYPRDVFNADETGIFYRLLPDKTYCFKGDSCHGGKQSKERITAMVCANMDGSEKLPLMVIGKFEWPRSFKNVKTLPVDYKFNKKAWMTSGIFSEWIRKLDKRFHAQRRNVVMFVDNCPAHPHLEKLNALKLVFLPPNATSRLQPCDMGIIKNLKVKYRRLVAMRVLDSIEANATHQITVLDAMNMLRRAWADVTQQTVANCFQKAGFDAKLCVAGSTPGTPVNGDSDDEFDDEDDLPLSSLLPNTDVTMDQYASVDDDVETCEQPSDDDIVADVVAASVPTTAVSDGEEKDDDNEDENAESIQAAPSRAEAMTAVETLLRYLCSTAHSSDAQNKLSEVEQFVLKKHCTRQMNIQDYIGQNA